MRRPDYQNLEDNLEEITDKRNAEIRAWGRQVLMDADNRTIRNQYGEVDREASGWGSVTVEPEPETDWDQINSEPVVEEVEVEPEEEEQVETVAEVPKSPRTRKPKDVSTS